MLSRALATDNNFMQHDYGKPYHTGFSEVDFLIWTFMCSFTATLWGHAKTNNKMANSVGLD